MNTGTKCSYASCAGESGGAEFAAPPAPVPELGARGLLLAARERRVRRAPLLLPRAPHPRTQQCSTYSNSSIYTCILTIMHEKSNSIQTSLAKFMEIYYTRMSSSFVRVLYKLHGKAYNTVPQYFLFNKWTSCASTMRVERRARLNSGGGGGGGADGGGARRAGPEQLRGPLLRAVPARVPRVPASPTLLQPLHTPQRYCWPRAETARPRARLARAAPRRAARAARVLSRQSNRWRRRRRRMQRRKRRWRGSRGFWRADANANVCTWNASN